MASFLENEKKKLRELVICTFKAAAEEEFGQKDMVCPEFIIEIPTDRAHGDFAANIAMVSARLLKKSPLAIAEAICKHMNLEDMFTERFEIKAPGFINFFLKKEWVGEVLSAVISEGDNYGKNNFGKGTRIMVEFVSANPTGPMHIGNARGGALGDCLASVLEWNGYDITREFYINDFGNQIEKFGISLEARYLQIFDGSVEMPEDAYHGGDITAHAEAFAKIHGDSFVSSPQKERQEALIAYALPLNIENLKNHLMKYRINYDVWFRESSLYKDGKFDRIMEIFNEKGLTYEKDGAVWYKASEYGGEKDEVLIRANGHPTYFAGDITYHYDKFHERGFDRVIDVWGADHHGHISRLKGAMDAIGLDGSRLDIVLTQMVRLLRNGEAAKLSKRSGKSITLVDLLEEVPIDAARFFFNLREMNTHLDFDMTLAVEESSQNPVYYVQYAHARICSIIKAVEKELKISGLDGNIINKTDFLLLSENSEKDLIRHIAIFPSILAESARVYDPSMITRYVLDIASLFHKFYNDCRVICGDEALMYARLSLCLCTRQVIRNVLSILKIDAPDSM